MAHAIIHQYKVGLGYEANTFRRRSVGLPFVSPTYRAKAYHQAGPLFN